MFCCSMKSGIKVLCNGEILLYTEVVADFKGREKELRRFKLSLQKKKIIKEALSYHIGYLLKTLPLIWLGVS